ncbi:ATP-binding cassette domain-containing protein [Bifidobacterium cuniculi]|uniref:Hydroxymethylpyrimidine transport ATP-binding protein n=1 Tax=Bifidobacterium cuniculi TaxID=1688 RepID=A0A087AQA1_9BIFI|nr:ATP-binding cassette domain-containing protein [Bifidobacterium cuniculi]KFI60951.1 Hydroxymethylpyrimidine transport ATP-binding protein [Bifidobacterium cuniculi]
MNHEARAAGAAVTFDRWGYRHASRNHFAVRGLDLEIRAGERVLLLGASGIGKSTILEGAAGLLGEVVAETRVDADGTAISEDADGGITEGRILIDGTDTHRARGKVGLVLQDPDAQAVFQRIGDNVAFGPENLDVPRERIWQRVQASLDAVGLGGLKLDRSVTHLSGGQLQRLALAGALAMEPDVLLLDEPTANLDPDGVAQIVGAVGDVLLRTGSTMILVEHRADRWISMIDRVVVLGLATDGARAATTQHGYEEEIDRTGFCNTVVVADGTPDEVFNDPTLDFAELGIWVPEAYRRPGDRIERIHTDGEPGYEPNLGSGDVVLSTQELSIGRAGHAIAEHLDLDFRPGQITALVGANGAGKSTLSLTLAGLLAPLGGQVVAGAALADGARGSDPIEWTSRQLASRISYVFQNPEHQFATSSVLDEVMLGPRRTGLNEDTARNRAMELLRRFHLAQYANQNPYTLSGGEKRRLTVAAALAAAPRVLILDEPTFGQDRRTWMQIARLIHSLRSDGVSIIVVTHDRDLVTALGARVVELVPGEGEGEWTAGCADATVPPSDSPDGLWTVQEPLPDATVVPVKAMGERADDIKPSSRSPFLASLNPVFRLFGAFLASLPLLLSLDWVSATVALGLEVVFLMAIGFTPWRIVRSTWPIFIGAPGSALAVLLYGKSGGDTWWQWGWIHVTDRSAELALATGIRILAIGIPAIIAVLGIDATDLADGFSQILHLPDRFVYGGLAGMRLFSVLQDDWAALTASRRSRGLGDDSKIRSFFPQAFALLVLSIRRSTTLAVAMQSRGFGGAGPRSHARVSHVHARDWWFLTGCLAIPAVALVSAVWAGTFSFMGN